MNTFILLFRDTGTVLGLEGIVKPVIAGVNRTSFLASLLFASFLFTTLFLATLLLTSFFLTTLLFTYR